MADDDTLPREAAAYLDMKAEPIAEVMGSPEPREDEKALAVYDWISLQVAAEWDAPLKPIDMDATFASLATAKGLHDAADRLRAAGAPVKADEMAGLGQVFLSYVAHDLALIASALNDMQRIHAGKETVQ